MSHRPFGVDFPIFSHESIHLLVIFQLAMFTPPCLPIISTWVCTNIGDTPGLPVICQIFLCPTCLFWVEPSFRQTYIYTYIIFVCLRLCTCIPDVYLIYVRISVYIYILLYVYIYIYITICIYIYITIYVYIYIHMWTGLQYDYCPSDWLTHVDMIVLSLSLSRTCLSCVSLFSDKPNKYHTLGHVSCISDIRLIPIKSTHSLLLKIPFLWGTLPCYILLVDSRFPTVD